jgi:pimeloyl-ACP methyl ester carboxylesterase
MTCVHVETIGSGPRVVLVHGSVTNSVTWRPVRDLSARYTLVIPDRPGYPPNPPLDHIDPEEQASELSPLLGDGAHVLGHSYGGVISLLLAAREHGRVRSLAVIEPPCFGVARGHPAVETFVHESSAVWADLPMSVPEFLPRFAALFGAEGQVPTEVAPEREQGVQALMVERSPWEIEIPLDELRRAPFPKLVFSSGNPHPAYEVLCDVLEERLGAERVVLPGAGHAVHRAPGFIERYQTFLETA